MKKILLLFTLLISMPSFASFARITLGNEDLDIKVFIINLRASSKLEYIVDKTNGICFVNKESTNSQEWIGVGFVVVPCQSLSGISMINEYLSE